jgi:hypothetical protein
VGGDHAVARGQVRRVEDGLDVLEGHVEVAEPADDLRDGDLLSSIAAIAGVSIHVGWLQHTDTVVVAQRFDAEMRRAGEVADG